MTIGTLSLAALLVAGLAAAQTPPAAPPEQPAPATPASDETGVRLSLRDTLVRALQANLDLMRVRKDPLIAERGVTSAEAQFDPNLTADYIDSNSKTPPGVEFRASGKSRRSTVDFGVTQSLRFGANYRATFTGTRWTGAGVSPSPLYQTGLDLAFTLPLLKGFGTEATTEQIVLARGNLEISRGQLVQQAQQTMQAVESAYWDLVAARNSLQVARQSQSLAGDLLTLNRKKVEVGTLAPIEITQAEAGVASREQDVIVAETALADAEDNLRAILGFTPTDPVWNRPLVPTDQPGSEPVTVNLEQAIDEALRTRPEVLNARHDLSNRQLSERVAHNAVRPDLTLALTANPSGTNDILILGVTPENQPILGAGSLGSSFSNLGNLNSYSWSAGLTWTLPIGNRRAKAEYETAILQRQQAEIAVLAAEQQVRVEVRTAVRGVESGSKQIAAARANVDLQRKKLEAEQKKFENGMSTSFEVLTFQNDLAAASLSEIQAVVNYSKAVAALYRAQGTLFQARGLALQEEQQQERNP